MPELPEVETVINGIKPKIIGKKIIKSRILISPIVAKETLYILTERGKIISFN